MTLGAKVGGGSAMACAWKGSVSDMSAYVCGRVERKVTSLVAGGHAAASGADALTRQSQIMFGASGPDGTVNAIIPGIFHDNGAGIDCVYETVRLAGLMRPHQLGGVCGNRVGYGDLFPS